MGELPSSLPWKHLLLWKIAVLLFLFVSFEFHIPN